MTWQAGVRQIESYWRVAFPAPAIHDRRAVTEETRATVVCPVPARDWHQRWAVAMFEAWRAQLAAIPAETVCEEAS